MDGADADGAATATRPVVFADVDGVLSFRAQEVLEPSALRALSALCSAVGAEVVVSSDWRRDAQLTSRLEAALHELGIPVAGSTPQRSRRQELRPVEIREWLEANGGVAGPWAGVCPRCGRRRGRTATGWWRWWKWRHNAVLRWI